MRLAVPDTPEATRLAERLTRGPAPVTEWRALPPWAVLPALDAGVADLALAPTLDVLRQPEGRVVLPGIGLVGGAWPWARLLLRHGLDRVETVAFDPRLPQEVLLTRMALKEHYGFTPTFLPVVPGEPAPEADAVLLTDEAPGPGGDGSPLVMDVGLEFYELSARPMVWALMLAAPDALDEEGMRLLAAAGSGTSADNEPSTRLDPFALGGLDAFADLLFFHGALPAVPDVPFFPLPEPDDPEPDDGQA